jgi:multiple antibiotic resistance protein
MLKTAAVAFATFFATIGPIDVAAMFAALTSGATPAHRRHMALKGTFIAAGILLVFALIGETLLSHLGISLAALRTAGGILLLLIGIDMVFARSSGGVSTTAAESAEARLKEDISVFPLATPLIAGPGAMGAAILLVANAQGDLALQTVVLVVMLSVVLLTFLALLAATQVQKLLGVTGLQVVTRVFGVLLCALAVQFLFDGIAQSGLLPEGAKQAGAGG